MRQRYHPYTTWEDWQAGMYRPGPIDQERVTAAGRLLSCSTCFDDTASLVVAEWHYSTEHNLSDLSQNRRAWLGQASSTYLIGATQAETCIAWNTHLTDEQRHSANLVAETIINTWYSSAFQLEMQYA